MKLKINIQFPEWIKGVTMKIKSVLVLLLTIALFQCQSASHEWGYHGEHGPEHWGGTCQSGSSQSPVNIDHPSKSSPRPIIFNYHSTAAKILNNGETVKIIFEPGNEIIVEGRTYALLQMHFHTPSEHTVGSQAQPIELHLVHKNQDGQLAVVGVFFKAGNRNAPLQSLWDKIPDTVNREDPAGNVDPSVFLPVERNYFAYSGSLTTPPCSEGVKWHVLKHPMEASAEQIATFKKIVEMNARPVQELNGRSVTEY